MSNILLMTHTDYSLIRLALLHEKEFGNVAVANYNELMMIAKLARDRGFSLAEDDALLVPPQVNTAKVWDGRLRE